MIIQNPTDQEIKVMINGVDYTLPANGNISVTEEVATYWVKELHSFLIVKKENKSPEVIKEIIETEPVKVKEVKSKK